MFIAVVARPRYDAQGNKVFDGKIGFFPFITKEPVKRSSVNQVAGTLETKAMTSVTRETVRSFLIENFLPAIREKWPREDANMPIFIQQDKARTHVDPTDTEFCQAARQDGFDIRLTCQPPNSSNLNILDLGFFRALQSLRYKRSARAPDNLVAAVEEAFEKYLTKKLNHIFVTSQLCMREIIRNRGGNNYKIPHIGKAYLEREGQLPTQIECDVNLVHEAFGLLK